MFYFNLNKICEEEDEKINALLALLLISVFRFDRQVYRGRNYTLRRSAVKGRVGAMRVGGFSPSSVQTCSGKGAKRRIGWLAGGLGAQRGLSRQSTAVLNEKRK